MRDLRSRLRQWIQANNPTRTLMTKKTRICSNREGIEPTLKRYPRPGSVSGGNKRLTVLGNIKRFCAAYDKKSLKNSIREFLGIPGRYWVTHCSYSPGLFLSGLSAGFSWTFSRKPPRMPLAKKIAESPYLSRSLSDAEMARAHFCLPSFAASRVVPARHQSLKLARRGGGWHGRFANSR